MSTYCFIFTACVHSSRAEQSKPTINIYARDNHSSDLNPQPAAIDLARCGTLFSDFSQKPDAVHACPMAKQAAKHSKTYLGQGKEEEKKTRQTSYSSTRYVSTLVHTTLVHVVTPTEANIRKKSTLSASHPAGVLNGGGGGITGEALPSPLPPGAKLSGVAGGSSVAGEVDIPAAVIEKKRKSKTYLPAVRTNRRLAGLDRLFSVVWCSSSLALFPPRHHAFFGVPLQQVKHRAGGACFCH